MCELAFNVAGERQGMCESALNLPDTRRTTQRWQSVRWSAGPGFIGKAGKKNSTEISKRMPAVTNSIGVNRFLGCLTIIFHVPRRAGRKDEVSGESNDVKGKDRHSFQHSIMA
jgi:hypothetical protein